MAASDDFCWLVDATASSATTAYSLCEQGGVYVTTDAGANWKMNKTGAAELLHAISFSTPGHGIAVGDKGTVLTTDDGSKSWKARDAGTTEHLLAVFALGSEAWAGGFDGTLVHSSDGGTTWTKQVSGTQQGIEALFFFDPQHGWAAGWSGTLLRTADGGKTWESTTGQDESSMSLNSLYFRDSKTGWAAGFSGQLLSTTDGGASWLKLKAPTVEWIKSVNADAKGNLWVSSDDGLYKSADGGTAWTSVPVEQNLFLGRLFRVGDSLWVSGQLGALRQSASGDKWIKIASLKPAGTTFADDTVDSTTQAVLDEAAAVGNEASAESH
jgi:photosystem II stability/assembly factor-like uncharacterized protein